MVLLILGEGRGLHGVRCLSLELLRAGVGRERRARRGHGSSGLGRGGAVGREGEGEGGRWGEGGKVGRGRAREMGGEGGKGTKMGKRVVEMYTHTNLCW